MSMERDIFRYENGRLFEVEDVVAEEHRLIINVNGEFYISMFCSIDDTVELVIGFLFSEGVITSIDDIERFEGTYSGFADYVIHTRFTNMTVWLHKSVPKDSFDATNRVRPPGFLSSSVRRPSLFDLPEPVNSDLCYRAEEICALAAEFNQRSQLFRETGATHSCALYLPDGRSHFAEDVGRHNAMDKVIGKALNRRDDMKNGILVTSGRVSTEMLLKSAGAGIPFVVSSAAATNEALFAALLLNITLIGFARGKRFNVYSGEERVIVD